MTPKSNVSAVLYLDDSADSKKAKKLLEKNGIPVTGRKSAVEQGEVRPRLLTGEGEFIGVNEIQMYLNVFKKVLKNLSEIQTRMLEDLLRKLIARWKCECAVTSSVERMTSHPAYQEIIRIGEQAVPFLLSELKKEPEHFFVALREITGVNPVPPESRGNIEEMTEAWLQWGRDRGYVC